MNASDVDNSNLASELPSTVQCTPSFTFDLRNLPDFVIADLIVFITPAVRSLTTYILPCILIIGFLGNIAFLFTLARVDSMRTLTNAYLANLSIADLTFIVFISFRTIWTIADSPYIIMNPYRQDVGCFMLDFILYVPYFASNGIVNLVSYERYLAICHALQYQSFRSTRRTVKLIAAVWIVSFGLAASVSPRESSMKRFCVLWPDHPQYNPMPSDLYYCTSSSEVFWNYPPILQSIIFMITFCVNIVLYSLIIRSLMKREVIGAKTGTTDVLRENQLQRINRQVVKMLVFNATAFFLCLAPWQFHGLHDVVNQMPDERWQIENHGRQPGDDSQSTTLIWTGTTLNCINASINPVIYNIVNARYRKALIQALGCSYRSQKESSSASVATVYTKV